MRNKLRILFLLLVSMVALTVQADSRVFTLVNPHPEEVLQALHNTYGDKLHADIMQGRLIVVGSKQQLDEVAALLVKLDPVPRALHLTLREQPPADATPGSITYSSDNGGGYAIDTVEGALIAIDYQNMTQQLSGIGMNPQYSLSRSGNSSTVTQNSAQNNNGWWIAIDNVPTRFTTLTLQIKTEGNRRAIVLVSYAKEENQERRVFGNTVIGDIGAWIPLLPRPADNDPNTINSGAKAGEQLYLRVERAH